MGYPKRLYHPDLGVEAEAHSVEQEAVFAESGWKPAPDQPAARPGYEPEPLRYVQGEDGLYRPETAVEPAAEPAKAKRAVKKSTDDES